MTTFKYKLDVSDGELTLLKELVNLRLVSINEQIAKGELKESSYKKKEMEFLLESLSCSTPYQTSGIF